MAIATMQLTRVYNKDGGYIQYMCEQCLHEIDYAGMNNHYRIDINHTSEATTCQVCGRQASDLMTPRMVESHISIASRHGGSWVKRLGQWHLSSHENSSETLCGQAKLGSNHEEIILPAFRKPCEKCFDVALAELL
jgi:hypothetical protein